MAGGEVPGERRREPRSAVAPGLECRLEMRARVRLVDISPMGALLSAESSLPVGSRAQLRTGLGASPFVVDVQVQRIADAVARDSSLALGAVFVGMDEQSRRSLETFLTKASE